MVNRKALAKLLDPLFVRRRKRLFAAVAADGVIDRAKLSAATVKADEYLARHAIAAAARQGGDAKQAPAESPQSGGAKTPHRPEQSA